MSDQKRDFRSGMIKSLSYQEKARKLIPGLTQLLAKRPDRYSYGVWPGYFSKAEGADIWDLDGNRYLDMSIGGVGANVLGYQDPDVDGAVIDAIKKGTSSSLNCPEEIDLAELLCEIHPWADMVRYAKTGGEAVAVAVRIARAHTGRDKVAFCGYHGWHDWYLAANLGSDDYLKGHLQAGLAPNGVPRALEGTAMPFNYNRLDELQKIIEKNGGDLAAIVMEPVRNMAPEKGFLDGVMALARENNITLIIDEITAGFRMNSGGAHLLYGLVPDIAVFGKSIGNGYPMAAVIGKKEVMEAVQKTFISSTFWTERVGLVAALATIKKHRRVNCPGHLIHIGEGIQHSLRKNADAFDISLTVQGLPPLTHFAFEYDNKLEIKAYFIQEMLRQEILATTGFYAMYAHAQSHVEQYDAAVKNVFESIRRIIAEGRNGFSERLMGEPSRIGFKRLN